MHLLRCALVLSIHAASATGQQQCAPCHPSQVQNFLGTPMANSISHRTAEDGAVLHRFSGSKLTISHRGDRLQHRLDRQGLTAGYTIAESIGAGQVGRSYLVRIAQHFFQSPASWYEQQQLWDMSPGYAGAKYPDFDRRIGEDCLFCHTGPSGLIPGTADRYTEAPLQPISCDRCHGPTQRHLEKPIADSIVNPPKLAPDKRNSVCEQCHLKGEARVLNPGKTWRDFQAGQNAESVFSTYVQQRHGEGEMLESVSQAEQFTASKCVKNNNERLWCGTCHNPHSDHTDRQREIREVCLGCHAQLFASSRHQSAVECVSCHMPRLPSEKVVHSSLTNHRIVRFARTEQKLLRSSDLIAWSLPEINLRGRNQGLAYFRAGYRSDDREQIAKAYDILIRLPSQQRKDPEVLMALGTILLSAPDPKLSVALLKQAQGLSPNSARYAYLLGMALDRAGDRSGAAAQLNRSILLDPIDPEAYLKLADMYRQANQDELRMATLNRYLRLFPQNMLMRELTKK